MLLISSLLSFDLNVVSTQDKFIGQLQRRIENTVTNCMR